MKKINIFLLCLMGSLTWTSAQQSIDLTAQEIFDKVVQYYDPNEIWEKFEGSMHLYSVWANTIDEQDISINNKTNAYRWTKYLVEGDYTKGMKNGEVYYAVNGKEIMPDQITKKLQGGPYSLNEKSARSMQEHHTFHFSTPLALYTAGAKPLAEVSTETLFGSECLAIKFAEVPNSYEKGMYHQYSFTLYVDPANNYRLHAIHADNGQWKDEKGIIVLLEGELEIGGLKIPARRLYFNAANHKYGFADMFSNDTRF